MVVINLRQGLISKLMQHSKVDKFRKREKKFVLYFVTVQQCPWYVTLAQSTLLDRLYIIWSLLDFNNICDLLRMKWREEKWVIHDMPSLNLSSIFEWKVNSKLPSHLFKKEDGSGGRGGGLLTAFLNLPQHWVICIEKGGYNNFAQVITILGNLYRKHCLLIKKCQWNTWDWSFSWE